MITFSRDDLERLKVDGAVPMPVINADTKAEAHDLMSHAHYQASNYFHMRGFNNSNSSSSINATHGQ